MKNLSLPEVRALRLKNLQIAEPEAKTVKGLVSWLGAMQAQDFPGAKWSIGLRIPGLIDLDIEKAIAEKSIIRTWPMRGTLHFVAAEDVRWMLGLLTPRVIASSAGRHRELLLDDRVFGESMDLILPELEGGKQLMRSEIFKILGDHGIETENQRGIHIISWLAQNQLICHGSHNEKQPTYVLMDEWVPKTLGLSEDEALEKLALRYFTSHGPATAKDFAWWAGLKMSDTKKAIELAGNKLEMVLCESAAYYLAAGNVEADIPDKALLLPGFDEYMLGYTDRSLILQPNHFQKIIPGNNGVFMPTMLLKGKVVGTWKRSFKKEKVLIDFFPFDKISATKERDFETQAKKFGKFLGKSIGSFNWH